MKKTLLVLALLASSSVFAGQINCVFETTDHDEVTGSEVEISDLKTDGNARIVEMSLFAETWIITATNVRNDGNVLITASKEVITGPASGVTQIDARQQPLNVSIKKDGTMSAGVTVKSTLPGTTNHLFCESK